MRPSPLAPLIALVALAPGCFVSRSSFNEPLAAEQLAHIRPGETTARELVELLGAPTDVVQLGRRSAYRYDFSNMKRQALFLLVISFLNEDTRADRAWIFLDEDDVVSHVGVTLSGDRVEYAMPWEDLHDELEYDVPARTEHGHGDWGEEAGEPASGAHDG